MKMTYKCLDCEHEVFGEGTKYDGTTCTLCSGPIVPIQNSKKLNEQEVYANFPLYEKTTS